MILIIIGSLRLRRDVHGSMTTMASETTSSDDADASHHEQGAGGSPADENRQRLHGALLRKQLTLEIIGEFILLSTVTAFFVYLIVPSFDWPWGARLVPQIAVIIGTPFLILRIIYVFHILFWGRTASVTPTQIMDFGFRVSGDPKQEARRWVRILCAIAALYLGIWLVGFHIALPVWIFAYMVWFGRANILIAAAIALLFVGLIAGVYGELINVPWPDPLLFTLFRDFLSS
jgi:hypothetical protein